MLLLLHRKLVRGSFFQEFALGNRGLLLLRFEQLKVQGPIPLVPMQDVKRNGRSLPEAQDYLRGADGPASL